MCASHQNFSPLSASPKSAQRAAKSLDNRPRITETASKWKIHMTPIETENAMEHEDEKKPAGNESDSAWKANAKPSGKRIYVPPRLVEYGNISDLRRAGKENLADLFKQGE